MEQHIQNILSYNYSLHPNTFILILFDSHSSLSRILFALYSHSIQSNPCECIDVETVEKNSILTKIENLPKHSLVILIQSSSFRFSKFRLRRDLARAGHSVIEHAHLSTIEDDQIQTYINSLTYDTPSYVQTSTKVIHLLSQSSSMTISSSAGILSLGSSLETPICNTGEFHGVNATAFPIGEVFTECRDLSKVNGSVTVFGFPTIDHKVYFCQPFTVVIDHGLLVSHDGPQAFEEILSMIRQDETEIQVREIGFGLNKSLGFHHRLSEPAAFERFCGVHLSIGKKHDLFRKKLSRKIIQKYHFDLFCLVDSVDIGQERVFENGRYTV